MSRQTSNNPSLGHTMMPLENYGSLMQTIRERFDVIGQLKASQPLTSLAQNLRPFTGAKSWKALRSPVLLRLRTV